MFNQDFLNLMDRIAHFITGIFPQNTLQSWPWVLYCASRSGWRLPCLQQCNTVRVPHAIPCIIVFTPRHATPSLQEYIPHHLSSLMVSLSCIKSIDDFCRSQLPLPAVSLAHTYSYTVVCCLAHGQPLAHSHPSVRRLDIDVLLRIKSPDPNCFQTKYPIFQSFSKHVHVWYNLIVVYLPHPSIPINAAKTFEGIFQHGLLSRMIFVMVTQSSPLCKPELFVII